MNKQTKITFKDIIKRITGISTPVFGISWEPPELERDKARRLMGILEDQRILFTRYDILETNPDYIGESLSDLRDRLTEEIIGLDRETFLAKSMSAIRAACRECSNLAYEFDPNFRAYVFPVMIGEFRARVGFQIAQICARYGLDVEADLASILPPEVENS